MQAVGYSMSTLSDPNPGTDHRYKLQSLTLCSTQPTPPPALRLTEFNPGTQYPVTTTEYADYLAATGYKPHDTYNWLKNWEGACRSHASILTTCAWTCTNRHQHTCSHERTNTQAHIYMCVCVCVCVRIRAYIIHTCISTT